MAKCGVLVATLLLVFMTEARVDAYLDPGSGSMLVQLLLGGAAGVAVIVKLGWHRLRAMIGLKERGKSPDG